MQNAFICIRIVIINRLMSTAAFVMNPHFQFQKQLPTVYLQLKFQLKIIEYYLPRFLKYLI